MTLIIRWVPQEPLLTDFRRWGGLAAKQISFSRSPHSLEADAVYRVRTRFAHAFDHEPLAGYHVVLVHSAQADGTSGDNYVCKNTPPLA